MSWSVLDFSEGELVGKFKDFKNSEFLHKNGFYVGIFPGLKNSTINIFKKM